MTSPRLARAGLAQPRVIVALALSMFALLLAAATPASAVTRQEAASKALKALGSKQGNDPVIVFGLTKPLKPGTVVGQRGSKKSAGKVGKERAFFFYEDGGPFQLYPHPGRVVLVGVKSGKVKVSRTINRAPLINGKLPAFLSTSKRYRSSKYRVFYRLADGTGTESEPETLAADPFAIGDPIGDPPAAHGNSNAPPKAHAQSVTVKQNSPKRIVLTGSDDDGDLITFHITKFPDHGTLSGQPPELTYTPDTGYLGNDDFFFKTNDGDHLSNAAKVSITVVPPGLPPTVMTSAGCTSYTEGSPAVAVDGQLTVSDVDDVNLDHASVRIATNFQGGDDLLFTDQNGITGSFSDNTGILTLTGTSSVANYEAALRSVRYRNLAAGNLTPTKDIEFVVNDAGNDSIPATKQVCITGGGTNDPPSGEPSEGGLSYTENDGQIPVDAGFVVGDPDSPNLSGATIKFVPLVSQPVDENGDPVGPPISTVTFAPDEDELYFTTQNGITGEYSDETGTMTLSGTSSIANYEAAIRSVNYENNSEDPSGLTRRLQFQVTDSSGANSTPSRRDVFVTPVNDAPVVTTSEGATSAIGASPSVTVDPELTTLDVDTADLKGAVVRISDGFASGDQLLFTDQPGITHAYDSETGVLTLTGTASVADYQTALRSIQYSNPGNPAGSRTVEFVVTDAELDAEPNELDSAPATKLIEVNDKPVLDTSDEALSYTEGDGSVAVDPGITAADADSPDLVGATVQVTSGWDGTQDELAFAEQGGITVASYDDDTGILTLTGNASVAAYQAALGDVRYENSSENPSDATRTVTFQADDGASNNNLSDPVTRDITVTPVNDAPVVTTSEGSTSYTENDPATTIDAGVTVADVDDPELVSGQVRIASGFQAGDELALDEELVPAGISVDFNAESGVLTLTGTGSPETYQAALAAVTYKHTGDDPSATSRTVEFTVNDGDVDSAAATKTVDVTPVNDAPVVTTSSGSTSYTIGGADAVVDAAVTASDVDDENLQSAQVRISSGFEAGDGLVLDEGTETQLSVDYFPGTGVMTLTGDAPVSDYQDALRLIKYRYSGETPPTSPKTVEFTVDDGDVDSAAATKEIVLSEPSDNEAPVVTTSPGATTWNMGDPAIEVDPALTVTDADDIELVSGVVRISDGFQAGDDLVYVNQNGINGVYNTGTGVLTLTGTATLADYQTALRSIKFRYAGEDPPNLTREVEFVVNDGDANSNPAIKGVAIIQLEL